MSQAVLKAFQSMILRPQDEIADADLRTMLELQILNYPAFALPSIEAPVVICGFVHFRGVCECWMVTGAGFERMAPMVLQQQQSLIRTMWSALKLHRLDMEIDAGREDARLWARRLGFEYEGTRRAASMDGGDLEVFTWNGNEAKGQEHDKAI